MEAEAQAARIPEDPVAALIEARSYREATAQCVALYAAPLGRFCMALLGTQAEAEEAVQETLIAAHDGMEGWRRDGSVRAWLYGIARRQCARRIERRTRQERKLHLVPGGKETDLPDDEVALRQRAARLRVALAELKPSEREAVLLRYEAGLSYREIGEACQIEEATARKRASRALVRLRALLSGDPDGSPDGSPIGSEV